MNDLTLPVLRELSQAEFLSGEALARSFHVSRGTIHNALKDAYRLGVSVLRARGRGYRLEHAPTWLNVQRILAATGDAATMLRVVVEPTCESTSTTLLHLARHGAVSGTVVAAELQTRGRGRRGRTWESELGSALTFSLLWRFERGVRAMSGLSLVVGVALVRALRRLGVRDLMLKWPNDLILPDGKLGGILVEVEGDALGPSVAVIGVGINVRLGASVQSRIEQPVAHLAGTSAKGLDRCTILGTLLQDLASAIPAFESNGFLPFRAEWEGCHAHQDRPVTLIAPDGKREEGIARGVDADGALLLDQGGSVRPLFVGEPSLRA